MKPAAEDNFIMRNGAGERLLPAEADEVHVHAFGVVVHKHDLIVP